MSSIASDDGAGALPHLLSCITCTDIYCCQGSTRPRPLPLSPAAPRLACPPLIVVYLPTYPPSTKEEKKKEKKKNNIPTTTKNPPRDTKHPNQKNNFLTSCSAWSSGFLFSIMFLS